jgi:hypothetical protein
MDGRRYKIKELLSEHGWELCEARKIDDCAIVEMWLVKSVWMPTDCFVFFTFETDPQDWVGSDAKPKAFRIVAKLKKPLDWMAESESQFEKNEKFDEKGYLYLTNIEKNIPEFFKDLANLRQKFYNFYN